MSSELTMVQAWIIYFCFVGAGFLAGALVGLHWNTKSNKRLQKTLQEIEEKYK